MKLLNFFQLFLLLLLFGCDRKQTNNVSYEESVAVKDSVNKQEPIFSENELNEYYEINGAIGDYLLDEHFQPNVKTSKDDYTTMDFASLDAMDLLSTIKTSMGLMGMNKTTALGHKNPYHIDYDFIIVLEEKAYYENHFKDAFYIRFGSFPKEKFDIWYEVAKVNYELFAKEFNLEERNGIVVRKYEVIRKDHHNQ